MASFSPYQTPISSYKPPAPTTYNGGMQGGGLMPLQQPKPSIPSNRNWASGTQAWDPNGIFYGNGNVPAVTRAPSPSMGMTSTGPTMGSFIATGGLNYANPGGGMGSDFTPAPTQTIMRAPMPEMGVETTGPTMGDFMPDPSQTQPADPSMDPGADQPWAPSAEYLRRNAMVAQGMDTPAIDGFNSQTGLPQDAPPPVDQGGQTNGGNSPPNYQFTMADIMANMPNTSMPTMDQIQQDPGYQWRLDQGLKALQGSAAARGSLQSSGTMKDILDYSQGAASQEYQNAYNRFAQNQQFNANQIQDAWGRLNGDRSAGQTADMNAFNQYANQRNFDQGQYQYNDTTGYNRYMDQVNGYNNLMSNSQKNSAGLAGTGYEAAKGISDLVTSSATALAGLGMNQAQIQAMSQMAASGQHTDVIKSILQLAGVALGTFA